VIFLVIFVFFIRKNKNYGYEWDNIGNKKDGTELRVKVVIERDKWTQIVVTMGFRGRKAKRFRENKEKKTAKNCKKMKNTKKSIVCRYL